MNATYDINFKKLIMLLLPTFLRGKRIVSLPRAAVLRIDFVHGEFSSNRKRNLYRTEMNGQVCRMRRMLNDAFPDANNRIRIDEGERGGEWIYAWDEEYDPYRRYLPITDEGVLIHDVGVMLDGVNNFIVYVPRRIFNANNDAKIRALLNEYKLVSKSYTITYE